LEGAIESKPFAYSRINVVGTSGTGKTTFSKKLASRLRYPYVEMDKIFWRPHWQQPTDEEFVTKLRHALDQKNWVLDGNYTRTIPVKWEKVELVIWLDYSFPRTLFQAVRRAFRRSLTQEELWEGTGNRESFRKSFLSKESIIWWTITTYKKVRLGYHQRMNDPRYAHIQFVRLQNHTEAEDFLRKLHI
jgi:adenylate kinase family enzyme